MEARIHPTALIEEGVQIGEGSSVWDNVHIRARHARIGRDCIVGEKTYIAYDVSIGNLVKINAFVYICAAVTIEDRRHDQRRDRLHQRPISAGDDRGPADSPPVGA